MRARYLKFVDNNKKDENWKVNKMNTSIFRNLQNFITKTIIFFYIYLNNKFNSFT